MYNHDLSDDIIAIATPPGQGAIGIIRLSGPNCISIVDTFFKGKNLTKVDGNSLHYGKIVNDADEVIDECIASVFLAPRSYTKENVVELSCHGSSYILDSILKLFINKGVRLANPGEFTLRAFLNGQLDLTQAEAVGDLIASESKSQHAMAMHQMRGGFSNSLSELKEKLIEFASLLELENDFGEEDVEFADRSQLKLLLCQALNDTRQLIKSFEYGNALKNGVPVSIVGKPNVGKSTLLNKLLNEDRAIVSDIPGTTRDIIEDTIDLEGVRFRFIDTAGIRDTTDTIESIGIAKTHESITRSKIILYITEIKEDFQSIVDEISELKLNVDQQLIVLLNKSDTFHGCHMYDVEEAVSTSLGRRRTIAISAQDGTGIDKLLSELVNSLKEFKTAGQVIINNVRHLEALNRLDAQLNKVSSNLVNIHVSSDLIATDIRYALHHIGVIMGTVSTDDLLDNIFSNFCIGK